MPEDIEVSGTTRAKCEADRAKCCLYQSLKSRPSKPHSEQDGYKNMATNVPLFQGLNAIYL